MRDVGVALQLDLGHRTVALQSIDQLRNIVVTEVLVRPVQNANAAVVRHALDVWQKSVAPCGRLHVVLNRLVEACAGHVHSDQRWAL